MWSTLPTASYARAVEPPPPRHTCLWVDAGQVHSANCKYMGRVGPYMQPHI